LQLKFGDDESANKVMSRRLLLTAPRECPGPLTALRNIKAVLADKLDCDLFVLEDLIFPIKVSDKSLQKQLIRVQRRLKIVTLDKLLPYGDNIIFASFEPIIVHLITELAKKGIRPSVMWCSTLSQAELVLPEIGLLKILFDLLQAGKIKHLMAHRRIFESYGYFIKKAVLFPHPIDLQIFEPVKKQQLEGSNLDLFCRPRLGKNILTQILGFKMAEIDAKLHINFDLGKLGKIVEAIGVKPIVHHWLPELDYYGLIAGMDLSLQVTFGESFNYAVAERMALRVPVLATFNIYLLAEDQFLSKYLCVSAIDTPKAIAQAIKQIVKEKNLRGELAHCCRERIEAVSRQNNQIVRDVAVSLFGQ
jgi:glycosyltransferase involved in cell wall biosynthesis